MLTLAHTLMLIAAITATLAVLTDTRPSPPAPARDRLPLLTPRVVPAVGIAPKVRPWGQLESDDPGTLALGSGWPDPPATVIDVGSRTAEIPIVRFDDLAGEEVAR